MTQSEKVNAGFFKSNAWEIINENDIETVISDAGNELIIHPAFMPRVI